MKGGYDTQAQVFADSPPRSGEDQVAASLGPKSQVAKTSATSRRALRRAYPEETSNCSDVSDKTQPRVSGGRRRDGDDADLFTFDVLVESDASPDREPTKHGVEETPGAFAVFQMKSRWRLNSST